MASMNIWKNLLTREGRKELRQAVQLYELKKADDEITRKITQLAEKDELKQFVSWLAEVVNKPDSQVDYVEVGQLAHLKWNLLMQQIPDLASLTQVKGWVKGDRVYSYRDNEGSWCNISYQEMIAQHRDFMEYDAKKSELENYSLAEIGPLGGGSKYLSFAYGEKGICKRVLDGLKFVIAD